VRYLNTAGALKGRGVQGALPCPLTILARGVVLPQTTPVLSGFKMTALQNVSLGLVVGGRRGQLRLARSAGKTAGQRLSANGLRRHAAQTPNACWATRTQSSCCPRRRECWPCGCTRTGCWDCGQMPKRPSRTQRAGVAHLDASLSSAGRTK
jgi:hypothetical protein